MYSSMRRTATIDYRVSRVPVLCKDCRYVSSRKFISIGTNWICRQDVGLYPARHICNNSKESQPPLPIVDLRAVATKYLHQPETNRNNDNVVNITNSATVTVERAKDAVGRGWEIVRSMNWRDGTKKEPESNGSRMWGKLLEATSNARQKVADKYYEVREGGNGTDCYFFYY
jgi:hypothetical protein